jgi:hypothetical protein
MIPLDLTDLPGPAQKIVSPGAPRKLQLMAAKGVVPGLRPDALVAVIVLLSVSADPDVAAQAGGTLAALPPPVLKGALDTDLPPAVILALSERYADRIDVLERLLAMPRVPLEAIEHLAAHGPEMTVELVATNEEQMLSHPHLIELVYMNKHARMSTANRLVELAIRNDIELVGMAAWKEIARAIQGELVAEPSAEALPEDELFWAQHELAEQLTDDALEDAYVELEDGTEVLEDKLKPLYMRLAEMTVSEKIRRAMLGTKEERLMLVRERNKVVSAAAARSPLMQENEVVQIARNRGVNEDVLRIIASTPEWMKSYQVKKNLVENAKTPIAIASRLVVQLREADLRKLARSKNVSSAVQMAARRHLERRKN